MSNINERNIFQAINKSIIDRCSNIESIYENVPFVNENIEVKSSLDLNSNITIPSSIRMIGGIGSAVGYVGGVICNNIFNKINKNSKNLSNLKIESGDW